MIITPVYRYQAPSVLKLMTIDWCVRTVATPIPAPLMEGNLQAKMLELRGWNYPRHLKGRSFAVVVHADSAGAEGLRRALCDWLSDMRLVPASAEACLDRFVGYGPYATSHDA